MRPTATTRVRSTSSTGPATGSGRAAKTSRLFRWKISSTAPPTWNSARRFRSARPRGDEDDVVVFVVPRAGVVLTAKDLHAWGRSGDAQVHASGACTHRRR